MEQDRYTISYRAAKVRQVMEWIKAGQSGCLIGLRGGGKSNLLRFLLREEVRQYYLGQDYTGFAFVLVDLLALTECTEWAVCELIFDRLLGQLHPLGIEEEIIEEMMSLQREVMRSRDLLTAYRAVERCVDVLCRRPTQRVVLLFSEFDAVFRTLDPSLFRSLRAIRNAHKGQVSYVVVVANDLASLRDDLTQVEHFYRLVSRNICILGPFNEADARHMIHYLASRRSAELSDKDTANVIELSGGHASLSLLWDTHYEGGLAELTPAFKDEPIVQAECRKIWESLSEGEQAALCAQAGGAQADPDMLRHLKRRGVVREGRLGTSIFSPLFAHFVHQQAPPLSIGTVISASPRIVQISRRRIENLTELEFEMLCYLYEHRGKVCTKDELIANVYRRKYHRMKGGVTDEALQTLISRLRKKIEPDRRRPRYIVTVREEGYRFVEPREQ